MSTTTVTTESVPTTQLQVGDIVWSHGMRVRLDGINYDSDEHPNQVEQYGRVLQFAGTVLNLDDVNASDSVPKGYRVRFSNRTALVRAEPQHFDYWAIQGNDNATWTVERTS
jgi:hypothetical protein